MTGVLPGTAHDLRYPRSPRLSGIAATTSTMVRFADYFRLDVAEVRQMHLLTYRDSAVVIDDGKARRHDPVDGITNANEGPPLGVGLGRLASPRNPWFCARCRNDRPQFDALSWRLRWHAACLEHGVVLSVESSPGHPATADATLMEAQRVVLSLLGQSSRRHFEIMDAVVAARLSTTHPRANWHSASPGDIAAALPAAVTAMHKADEQGPYLIEGLARRTSYATTAERLTAPMKIRRSRVDGQRLPQLLPTRHLIPDLADLIPPDLVSTGLRRSRRISALAVYMCATGTTAATAAAAVDVNAVPQLIRALIDLRNHGRDTAFWSAVHAATDAILAEDIDYARRRAELDDTARLASIHAAATAAAPNASKHLLITWVVDQWACRDTKLKERPSSLKGMIEPYDRLHGPAMTAAIELLRTADVA